MVCECGSFVRPCQALRGQSGRAVVQATPKSSPNPSSLGPIDPGLALPFALTTQSAELWKV